VLHKDKIGRPLLVAYVATTCNSPVPIGELRDNVKKKLPAYMVPSKFLLLDRFPTGPNGKTDRKRCRCRKKENGRLGPFILRDHQWKKRWCPSGRRFLSAKTSGSVTTSLKWVVIRSRLSEWSVQSTGSSNLSAITALPITGKERPTVVKLHEGTAAARPIYFIGAELFQLAQLVGGQHSMFGIDFPWPVPWSDTLEANKAYSSLKMEQLVEPLVLTLVKQIPSSPCLLVGYSFAGLAAFEIAHQLQMQGRKVELVILLDTRAKRCKARQSAWSKFQEECQADWHRWQQKWKNRVSTRQFLQALTVAAINRATIKALTHTVRKDGVELSWQQLLDKILLSYQPQRIESRGVLFLTQEFGAHAALGWGELFGQGLMIIPVPGNHLSMLADPHIRRLVSEIKAVFRRDLENAA
jgi:thioesterase domain-containing protein